MKKQTGITLVALVITVIILLILAGITINLTVGQKGIIARAIQAKENTIRAQEEEEKALNQLWGELENGGVKDDSNSPSGGDGKDESTAKEEHILEGYKAYSGGKLLIGTMPNREAITKSLNAGESYTILEGYHNGKGVITANSLASQTRATAVTGDIAKGKTAWVNGELIEGTGMNIPVSFSSGNVEILYSYARYGKINNTYTFSGNYDCVIATVQDVSVDKGYTTSCSFSTTVESNYLLNQYSFSGSGTGEQKCSFALLNNVKVGDTLTYYAR